jgi:hypothetical protein
MYCALIDHRATLSIMNWTSAAPERVANRSSPTSVRRLKDSSTSSAPRWCGSPQTCEQLACRAISPSSLSLLGLVRHLTEAERGLFRREFAGEDVPHPYSTDDQPDAAFANASADTAEQDIATLVAEWDLARAAIAGAALDDCFTDPDTTAASLGARTSRPRFSL